MNSNQPQTNSSFPSAEEFTSLRRKIVNLSEAFVREQIDYQSFRQHTSVIQEEARDLQVMMKTLRLIERCGADREKHRRALPKSKAIAA